MEKYYLCRRININDKIIRDLKDLMDFKVTIILSILKILDKKLTSLIKTKFLINHDEKDCIIANVVRNRDDG